MPFSLADPHAAMVACKRGQGRARARVWRRLGFANLVKGRAVRTAKRLERERSEALAIGQSIGQSADLLGETPAFSIAIPSGPSDCVSGVPTKPRPRRARADTRSPVTVLTDDPPQNARAKRPSKPPRHQPRSWSDFPKYEGP